MQASGSVVAGVIKGAVAGAAGGWASDKVTTFIWEHESPAARERYEQVTGGV